MIRTTLFWLFTLLGSRLSFFILIVTGYLYLSEELNEREAGPYMVMGLAVTFIVGAFRSLARYVARSPSIRRPRMPKPPKPVGPQPVSVPLKPLSLFSAPSERRIRKSLPADIRRIMD